MLGLQNLHLDISYIASVNASLACSNSDGYVIVALAWLYFFILTYQCQHIRDYSFIMMDMGLCSVESCIGLFESLGWIAL